MRIRLDLAKDSVTDTPIRKHTIK